MALSLKDFNPETVVDAVSAGPAYVSKTLKRALEMGADRAFRIDMGEADVWHPETVAAKMADFTRGCGYDLIITGAMSEDLMQGITGPLIAAQLRLPVVPSVVEAEVSRGGSHLTVTGELEGGVREHGEIKLPALISVQSGLQSPRYPTLTSKLRARKQEINPVPAMNTMSPVPKGTFVFGRPGRRSEVAMIEGSPEEKAKGLLKIFYREGVL